MSIDSNEHLNVMNDIAPTMAEQIAQVVTDFQHRETGRNPVSVSVVLSGDTLVVTLYGALSPAEKAMSQTPEGAAKVQEFHQQLFFNSAQSLRKDIKRITGMDVREATTQVEPATGAVVQVFTSGNMVQVFHLSGNVPTEAFESDGTPNDPKPSTT